MKGNNANYESTGIDTVDLRVLTLIVIIQTFLNTYKYTTNRHSAVDIFILQSTVK
jgi:hypothetical protein